MTVDVHTVENRPPPSDMGGTKIHPLNSTKQSGNHLRSLVVDDDHMILKFVARMLTMLGFQGVDTAQKQPEVVRMLATGPYDLIVTDLEMPDMNGYHLTHRIKRQMQDANVIIMTGRHKDECLELMASRWVDGWLFKPFGLNELRDMIRLFGLLKY
jgi:two-component system capsular synthesis sensor histidine kinase RcsC